MCLTKVDTLIITKRVWEDPESKTCLMPFVWTAKKVIIVNKDGKFENIKLKDNTMNKKENLTWRPKINANENTIFILRIKMPMNMITYKFLDNNNQEMDTRGVSAIDDVGIAKTDKFRAYIAGIPEYLIKRIDFPSLDFSQGEIAVATVYCYLPVDESIFSVDKYIHEYANDVYHIQIIKEIQHKGIVAKINTKKVRRKDALDDCDCPLCVDNIEI